MLGILVVRDRVLSAGVRLGSGVGPARDRYAWTTGAWRRAAAVSPAPGTPA